MPEVSVFHEMASLVKVRHLKSPLGPELSAEELCEEATNQLAHLACCLEYDETSRVSVVVDEGNPVGWCSWHHLVDYEERDRFKPGSVVRDIMALIRPAQILAADTALLDAIELFGERSEDFFFILDGGEFTGTLHFEDLSRLPALLCLFALTAELETAALDLCTRFAECCWKALSPGRQEKARAVFKNRGMTPPINTESFLKALGDPSSPVEYGEPLPKELLRCTMFCDKAQMIAKCRLLKGWSRERLESLLAKVERVRNACAHSAGGEEATSIITRGELPAFIHECRDLINGINSAIDSSDSIPKD